jgi:hypothetical protein
VDDARQTELERILERLGRAIEDAVAGSDEFHRCLAELDRGDWCADVVIDTSMAVGAAAFESTGERLRIRVGATRRAAEYRLTVHDARWLAAIGISPSRHRSHPRRLLPPVTRPRPQAHDDL